MDDFKAGCGILIIIIVLIFVGVNIMYSFNDTELILKVDEKLTKKKGDTEKYLVFCQDGDGNLIQLQNTDKFIRGKFNSSEIQHKIKEGHVYKFTVVGFRLGITSSYKNILKIEANKK